MYQHLTECKMNAENMQISFFFFFFFLFFFCKTCTCLKSLENIHISVNMIDRLDITDEYSVKGDFILNTVIFIDAALSISSRKVWKCNVLWFYLFALGVPNETKGMINLKCNFTDWGYLCLCCQRNSWNALTKYNVLLIILNIFY